MSNPDDDPVLPKVTLPKNLPDVLKRLSDIEVEALLRDVTAEAERRGVSVAQPRTAPREQKARASLAKRVSREPVDALPAGKANLIKASHQAGMKPAAIARSFRLSQSVVNRVLNQPSKSAK
jgi:DNA invertase Pin-like site-specific DNA recombinase